MKKLFKKFSEKSRKKRAKIFLNKLSPQKEATIVDLGGGNGKYIHAIVKDLHPLNITIADILKEDLDYAKNTFGYKTAVLNESKKLPFEDNTFDIVFCNSVIEHVTIPKDQIWKLKNTKEFERLSLLRQHEFANEIRRIGKSYFVQTPNKYFLIESHSWLPGIVAVMPRNIQIETIRLFNKFWFKKTAPDWNLLTYTKMQQLFPDATIYREKSFGFTKSLMAIKKVD